MELFLCQYVTPTKTRCLGIHTSKLYTPITINSKHWIFILSHSLNSMFLSLFWPKKVHFKAKITLFLILMLIKLVLTLQCKETSILLFFLPMKKSKVFYQNFRTALTTQSAPKQKITTVFRVLKVCNFGMHLNSQAILT